MDKPSTGKQASDKKPKSYQRTRYLVSKKICGDPPKSKGDHINKGEELVSKKVEEFHTALKISQLPPKTKNMVIQRIQMATITEHTSSNYKMHLQGILHKIETMRTEAGKINQKVTEFHEALETSQLPPQAKKLVTEHIDDYISEKLKRGDFREHSQVILDKIKTISKTMGEVVSKVNNGPEKIQKALETATLPDDLKVVINKYFDSERKRIQTSTKNSTWENWESLASDIEDIGELVDMFRVTLPEGLAQNQATREVETLVNG